MSPSKFPHPFALLTACVLVAAALTWLLPAGEYERRDDSAAGREIVVAGTYRVVEPRPVGPFEAVTAIPRGIVAAGTVIAFVFLLGGAITVVNRTGALAHAVSVLVARGAGAPALVLVGASLLFAAGGALNNTQEELVAVMPLLLLLVHRLGYDRMVALAISLGPAGIGAAFSPINPFQVGLAQTVAGLPLMSGAVFRLAFLAFALGVWIEATLRYARKTRGDVDDAQVAPDADTGAGAPTTRRRLVLSIVAVTFVIFVIGVVRLGWNLDQMGALFFVMGAVAGIAGGLGVRGTSEAFIDGFRTMAYPALMIGLARSIYVVLEDGRIVDTLVHGLFLPLGDLPVALSAVGMVAAQALVHIPVPSVSGQAVLTVPVVAPLADLLGMSRQVAVLAFQYGAGLSDLLTPTNGSMVAVAASAGISWDRWFRFAAPRLTLVFAVGMIAVAVAVAIGLS